ncbi:hypothetical protein B0J17DRAFT_718196 [Rhizoctonia solani]|nr:hypothetical protein B0J17DRAFT_718196 [Rhizoctonia solani]
MNVFMTKVFDATVWSGTSLEGLYKGLEVVQVQLDLHLKGGPYLGGERMNIADAAMAPFFLFSFLLVWMRIIDTTPYVCALLVRETVKSSFPEEKYLERVKAIKGKA